MLDHLGRVGVPYVAIHSDRDLIVPLPTARSAARRAGGELVVVQGASHSWLIGDPLTLPGIVAELIAGQSAGPCARPAAATTATTTGQGARAVAAIGPDPAAPRAPPAPLHLAHRTPLSRVARSEGQRQTREEAELAAPGFAPGGLRRSWKGY